MFTVICCAYSKHPKVFTPVFGRCHDGIVAYTPKSMCASTETESRPDANFCRH